MVVRGLQGLRYAYLKLQHPARRPVEKKAASSGLEVGEFGS